MTTAQPTCAERKQYTKHATDEERRTAVLESKRRTYWRRKNAEIEDATVQKLRAPNGSIVDYAAYMHEHTQIYRDANRDLVNQRDRIRHQQKKCQAMTENLILA